MGNVKVISLAPDGTYSQRDATLKDKYIEIPGTEPEVVLLNRAAVFPKQRPVPFDTLEDLLAAKPPIPTFDDSQRQVLVCRNDGYPVTHDANEWAGKVSKEATILNQVTRNDKLQEQAYSRSTEERMTLAFVIIASVAGAIALLVVLIMALVIFF